MEKIAAACAMEWSIELEKGLRSKNSGQSIESICLVGHRLRQWSGEPKLTMAICNMFGLVPGEDRLFADAILLRLADAFRSGDMDTRICIVKIFLADKKSRRKLGIFSKLSMENQIEVLTRVKCVLDTEDFKGRALALALLGCWADIAKDVPGIRHAILSSLFSSHVLEVNASLFAGGCFCELSDEFASIFLEMLINVMASPETSSSVRQSGARAFAKLGCSTSLVHKSYKAGSELLVKFSEESFLTTMLISLSKLASKSGALVSQQVGLLNSFLTQKASLHVQATALRCMSNIAERRASQIPISAYCKTILRLLDEASVPCLRFEALQIFCKISSGTVPGMLLMEMNEFIKLLVHVKHATRSLLLSERLLAIQVLIHVSRKLNKRMKLTSGADSDNLLPEFVSLAGDHISEILKRNSEGSQMSEVEREFKGVLKLLLVLFENYPELGPMILDKLYFLIQHVANVHAVPVATTQIGAVHRIVEARAKENSFIKKLMIYIYRFLVVCLECTDEADVAVAQILRKVRQLVSFVCKCSLFSCSIHTIYALLLHSHVPENKKIDNSDQELNTSMEGPVDEALVQECAGNMLAGESWFAYKAGQYAACKGVWYAANFIFQRLTSRVQSDVCSCWLISLVLFTLSERNIQSLHPIVDHGSKDVIDNYGGCIVDPESIGKLVEARDGLCSSENMLRASAISNQTFCFQRWFLALRAKILTVVIDLLKFVATNLSCEDSVSSIRQTAESNAHDPCSLQLMENISFLGIITSRLKRLGQELDLIGSSFTDMDSQSLEVISALALGCSVLAFCTGFTYFHPNTLVRRNLATCNGNNPANCLHIVLVQDLIGRVGLMDSETCINLLSLLKDGVHGGTFRSSSRFKISNLSCKSKTILALCRSAVKGISSLQNEFERVQGENKLSRISKDGSQFLLNAIGQWMCLPFRVPKYFFSVRPSAGALLLSSNMDANNPNELTLLAGSQLPLNLCIQLKNVPPGFPSQLTEIFCILYCRTSFLIMTPNPESDGQVLTDHHDWASDTMIDLNEKLWAHMIKQTGDSMSSVHVCMDSQEVESYVSFRANGMTQCFSTCLLDVSAFPVGSYRIQWLSCCVDSEGSYWNILPLNYGPVFTVTKSSSG